MPLSKARQEYWAERLRKANAEQKDLFDSRPVFIAMGPAVEEIVNSWDWSPRELEALRKEPKK